MATTRVLLLQALPFNFRVMLQIKLPGRHGMSLGGATRSRYAGRALLHLFGAPRHWLTTLRRHDISLCPGQKKSHPELRKSIQPRHSRCAAGPPPLLQCTENGRVAAPRQPVLESLRSTTSRPTTRQNAPPSSAVPFSCRQQCEALQDKVVDAPPLRQPIAPRLGRHNSQHDQGGHTATPIPLPATVLFFYYFFFFWKIILKSPLCPRHHVSWTAFTSRRLGFQDAGRHEH